MKIKTKKRGNGKEVKTYAFLRGEEDRVASSRESEPKEGT